MARPAPGVADVQTKEFNRAPALVDMLRRYMVDVTHAVVMPAAWV